MDLQNELKKSAAEEMVESMLDDFSIPKKKGYRLLRSIILMMYKDPSLSVRGAQLQLAEELGLQYHTVRYHVDRVLNVARDKGYLLPISGEGVSTSDFISYCVCKMPGAN